MRTEFSLKQWNVGHGGFNTQSLRHYAISKLAHQANPFNIVYDCGSSGPQANRLSDKIDEYVSGLKTERQTDIDALILSHMDEDHVNGVNLLLTKAAQSNITIKKVLLPYLTPLQTLLLGAQNQHATQNNDYLRILFAPQLFFSEFDIRETIPVPEGSSQQVANWTNPQRQSTDWIFTTFNQPGKPHKPQEIDEIIGHYLPEVGNLRNLNRRKLIDISAKTPKIIKKIIGELSQSLPKTKNHDDSVANFSSLCAYSGPSTHTKDQGNSSHSPIGWMGTGDARLMLPPEINLFATAFQSQLSAVKIVSAPHHGSRRNSDINFWKLFPNMDTVTIEASGRYNLPNCEVLRAASNYVSHVEIVNKIPYEYKVTL